MKIRMLLVIGFMSLVSLGCLSYVPPTTSTVDAAPATDAGTADSGVGALGQPCGVGSICNAGLVCTLGVCVNPTPPVDSGMPVADSGVDSGVACGAATEPCCIGADCDHGLVCMSGVCRTPVADSGVVCGSTGQPCCSGSSCGAGLVCMGGMCQTTIPSTDAGTGGVQCGSGHVCAVEIPSPSAGYPAASAAALIPPQSGFLSISLCFALRPLCTPGTPSCFDFLQNPVASYAWSLHGADDYALDGTAPTVTGMAPAVGTQRCLFYMVPDHAGEATANVFYTNTSGPHGTWAAVGHVSTDATVPPRQNVDLWAWQLVSDGAGGWAWRTLAPFAQSGQCGAQGGNIGFMGDGCLPPDGFGNPMSCPALAGETETAANANGRCLPR